MENLQITLNKLKVILKEQKDMIHIFFEKEKESNLIENYEKELIELQLNNLIQNKNFNEIKKQIFLSNKKISHLKLIIKEKDNKNKLKNSIYNLEEFLKV